MHLLGAYSTCLYSIGSSAACQQSASRLKCENYETQRKEQESSRGHKFSILENFLSIRDFTSSTHVSFRSALVGACLPQTLLERVRQTGSYSAIFFHFLILVLNVPNGATVLTCINLYTSQTAVLVDSSAHFLICGSNNSSSLNESIIS